MLNSQSSSGFTLVELLVVITTIAILAVLVAPAFTNTKKADELTNAAYTIKEVCEHARSYAKANHTYTWVGFYEENASSVAPTNATPAYPGKGRVVIATVRSNDGTRILDDNDPSPMLPAARITQFGKLNRIEGIHITDLGKPTGGNPDTFNGRPDSPYAEGSPFDHFNRISSDSADATQFAFTVQNYTFYKTIRFNPRDEANINSTYTLKHTAEIGIRSARGDAVDVNSPNVIAIQFGGIGANFKIYRR